MTNILFKNTSFDENQKLRLKETADSTVDTNGQDGAVIYAAPHLDVGLAPVSAADEPGVVKQIVFKNLTGEPKDLRLIPSSHATVNLGTQSGAVTINDDMILIALGAYAPPSISCADANTGITFEGDIVTMLAGKRITAVMDGNTTTLDIPSDIGEGVTDLINTTFTGLFGIIYAYNPGEAWGIDSGDWKPTSDIRVTITSIEADYTFGNWVEKDHLDGDDVNAGLNASLVKELISINFCMKPYPPVASISCTGSLPVTGVIEITGPISFAMGESDPLVEYATAEELVSAMTSAGLVIEIVSPEEPIGESELIFNNEVIASDIPIDGTKKFVMDVTITKDGVTEVMPFEGVIDNDTFPPYRALAIFGWLGFTLPQQEKYSNLPSYLVADVVTGTVEPSEPTLTLGGLADADIDVVDELIIHFSPRASLGPDELDYYAVTLAERYPAEGVTLRLKGRITPSDIVFGKLSNDDSLFIHRVDKSDVAVALRKINPDLTYTNLTLPENITVDNATNLGRFETSKDGSLIIGVSDEDIAVSPIYGYLVDGDTLQSLTFDINGQTPFDSGSQVSISPNNKLITLTGYKVGPLLPCKVYIRDKVDALKFKAVGIIPNNEGFDNRTVTFISDTLVITRQYEGDGYRYSAVELTVDYDLETVTSVYKGSVLIENTSGSGLFSSEYLNVLPGTSKFIDSIADKFVLLDFTDPINPTANTIYTDNEYRTAPGTAQGTETMLMNGKFVYISILFNITVIKVWDIDLVTGAISNMVKTDNVLDIYSVFKYSDAKRVFVALVGSNLLKEKYYKVKPDNTVEVITIPYLG